MDDNKTFPEFYHAQINLLSPRLGTKVVCASDEFFGAKERLILDEEPIFVPDKYDNNGKWMDGWESRRRRDNGNDWCLIRMGVPGHIFGVNIDTRHFSGNYPPKASVSACVSDRQPDELSNWSEPLPPFCLDPDSRHFKDFSDVGPWNWLRLNIFPDGGVARLRAYGKPFVDWSKKKSNTIHELSALKNGGQIIGYNDAHYGDVWAILTEGRGTSMGDGWETRRRRYPGNDWIVIGLGAPGIIEKVEIDTAYFKGNYPDQCSIQGVLLADQKKKNNLLQTELDKFSESWNTLMNPQKLSADKIHFFSKDNFSNIGPITHLRLNIHPDGGISRFRVFGKPLL